MGPYLPKIPYRAIGACYLLRQVAGSEMVGGLQVTVWPRSDDAGTIQVIATEWRTGRDLAGLLENYAEEAIRGIREVAEGHAIRLSEFDVQLSDFLVHDVDSAPKCYYQAGKSAFRSAFEALRRSDLPRGHA